VKVRVLSRAQNPGPRYASLPLAVEPAPFPTDAPPDAVSRSSRPIPGLAPALTLIVAAVLFAVMATAAKQASATLPGPQVAFVRFVVGIAACALVAFRIRLKAKNKLGLFLRGAFGGAAVLFYFLAIQHLHVGIATLLNYTAPVFSAIYAATWLGEGVSRSTLLALALTTAGVACVIFSTAPPGTLGLGVWQLAGILSAMLSGAAVATIREVRRTDGSWEIFLAFCLGGALITAPQTFAHWQHPTTFEWGLLLAVGLLSLVAQLLMTYALRWVRAAVAGVIAQLTPVTALLLGWWLFGEILAGLALFGAALTLLGVGLGACVASAPDLAAPKAASLASGDPPT
jgi:drug/metabolite transporter (DMT)-like permease